MSEHPLDLSSVSALYASNYQELGINSRTLGWKSVEQQKLRFDILTQYLVPQTKCDVIDYGCGFADLADFLITDKKIDLQNYFGYEIDHSIANQARNTLTPHSICGEISETPDIIHECDWSFVSGTFNVRVNNSAKQWERFVKQALKQLFDASRIGLAFNCLSVFNDWYVPDLYYADPASFLGYFKKTLNGSVSLFHNYPLFEWTMIVEKR